MKVLLTRRIPSSVLSQLAAHHQVDLYTGDAAISRGELLARVADKDALICLLTEQVDAELMDAAPALKIISAIAVGYDNIDVKAAAARGIVVTNTPDVLTEAVAEFTWALILGLARRVAEGDRMVRAGAWKGWGLDFMLGTELRGKTLGIVGAGRIGRAVAAKAPAFGMKVVFAWHGHASDPRDPRPASSDPRDPRPISSDPRDPRPVSSDPRDLRPISSDPRDPRPISSDPRDPRRVSSGPRDPRRVSSGPRDPRLASSDPRDPRPVSSDPRDPRPISSDPRDPRPISSDPRLSLDELLVTSDVISIHAPLTERTRHLIDKRAFARMKRSALLVNTARGPIVDEAALAWALGEHLIAGAALDVYEREPDVTPALKTFENVLLAPHLGSATRETRTAMAELAVKNVLAVLAGHDPLTPVD